LRKQEEVASDTHQQPTTHTAVTLVIVHSGKEQDLLYTTQAIEACR